MKIPYSLFPIPYSTRRGFGLIEVVIGSAVLSVALFGISGFFHTVLKTSGITESAVQGDYLLEEGIEVTKIFRDMNYTSNIKNMSTSTTYYFSWDGTNWATTTTKTIVDDKFERELAFEDVKRDSITKDISDTGVYDPDIKLVTVSVAWWTPVVGTTTRSIQTYIVNLFNN